ncbi:Gmad2 immunoglobulin-like domain-containing protein [Neobacillus sp. Marseille-QA0830]
MRILICILLIFFPLMLNTDANEVVHFPGIRNVMVSGGNGTYTVKGEANEGFFYTVEDGHNQYIEEQKVLAGGKKTEWQQFSISVRIPSGRLPDNGTLMFHFYQRKQNGQIIYEYPVVLERF